MLLYLVQHSHPDITNSVHEILKVFDGAYLAAFKEMLHVVKFVLDTKNYGLKFSQIWINKRFGSCLLQQ